MTRLPLPGISPREILGVLVATEKPPSDLEARGAGLWSGLRAQGVFSPAQRVLVEEACRIADRLDKLHRLLSGDAQDWIGLRDVKGHEDIAEIVIDKPLAEARQQAVALKQLLTELRQSRGLDAGTAGGDELDELAARRAARIANTAGS